MRLVSGTLDLIDVATLYELSLSIGHSLDPRQACEGFLPKLLSRRTLDLASVWLDPRQAPGYGNSEALSEGSLELLYSYPQHRTLASRDLEGLQLLHAARTKGFLLSSEDSAQCRDNLERLATEGSLAVFPLGEVGVLRLGSDRPQGLDRRECRLLERLVQQFATSMTACLAHAQMIAEVAERRRAQAELRRTNTLLQTLAHNIHAGVLVEDEARTVLQVNAVLCRMFGDSLDPESLQGRDCRQVAKQASQLFAEPSAFLELVDRCVAAGEKVQGARLRVRDGRVFELDYSPLATEGIGHGHLWQYRDISEQVRSFEAIEGKERRLRLLIENALDAVITIDQQGRVVDWNPQAETVFGWPRTEVLGRALAELIVPHQHREAHLQGMATFERTGVGPVLNDRFETTALHRDGKEFPIELTIHPVLGQGETTFTAFARDITERRVVERMKDDLVATVSHELRTPLTSLQGFVELLLHRPVDEARRRKFLQVMHDEATRLARLVSDLLDIQRLESGHVEYQLQPLQLEELVREMVEVFRPQAEQHQIRLHIEPALPRVLGDPDRLRQVIANLLSNAIKFSVEPGDIELYLERRREGLRLRVRDHGIGIALEDQERLFEKFFRGEQATQQAISGSGLGLALAQQIVAGHDGTISVRSRPGQGTEFRVDLPEDRLILDRSSSH